MADNKHSSEGKNKVLLLKSPRSSFVTRAQANQLQKELDQLALLLDEVKRQTEKVEAAADAIGDALISQLQVVADEKDRQKAGSRPDTRTNSRRVLRSFPDPMRPQGLDRAQG